MEISIVTTAGALFFFVVGACVGSFLNVVIHRLPNGGSIVFPASHCPVCKAGIHYYDNIPVLSFLVLRGRCRSCQARISWQYPLVEGAMALLSLALFYKFGPSLPFIFYFIFTAALVAIFVIDLHHQIIPDVISLPGILLGFVFSFFNPLVSWQASGLGILLGGGTLYFVALAYVVIKKIEGMGGGDVKLLGMIGAFLGWQSLPFVILGSSMAGTLAGAAVWIRQKAAGDREASFGKTRIPFGPFLAVAAVAYMLQREAIDRFLILYLKGQL